MDEKKCPRCGHSSTVNHWDDNTKREEGIKPGDKYISLADSLDNHREYQTYYRCPICNEEVAGSDLVKE